MDSTGRFKMGPSGVAFLNFNQPDNLTQFIGEQSEHKGGMNKNDKMTSQDTRDESYFAPSSFPINSCTWAVISPSSFVLDSNNTTINLLGR